jgi:hypothetical protein
MKANYSGIETEDYIVCVCLKKLYADADLMHTAELAALR